MRTPSAPLHVSPLQLATPSQLNADEFVVNETFRETHA
jgi:hypothetical protein